ncbi:MAG: hypothetical protein WBP45_06185 [Daejeonella sp.]
MNELLHRNILFFCPQFFEYEKHIKLTLEDLGAKVIWYDDRPSNNIFSKALIRVNKKIISKKIDSYYENVIKKVLITEKKIHFIFFVNPESINLTSINNIKNSFKDAKMILYMWDSFRNRKKNIELLPFFDSKFSFDPKDVNNYNLQFRPLFYIDKYRDFDKKLKYDLLFIGTAHSDRYKYINKIISNLNIEITVKVYFFLNSKLLFLFKKITDRDFRSVKYKDISFKALSHSQNANLMSESKAILDINHPQQVGLTMRTFEALGAQRKLITTNADIKNYDFYNENNILIIDRENPIIDDCFFLSPFSPYAPELLFKYSIKGWIYSLFSLK